MERDENLTIDQKAEQLAEFLDIDVDQIEKPETDDAWSEYKTPEGTYTVLTEYEAEEAAGTDIKDLIDEFGIDGFTEAFRDEICCCCVDQDELRDIVEENKSLYLDDLSTDEILEYAVDYCIIDQDEIDKYDEDEDKEDKLDSLADSLRDDVLENMMDEIDSDYRGNYARYLRDNYGDDELITLLKNNPNLLDTDEIVRRCIDADGLGHNLARWDGETNETDDFYVFQQGNQDERSEEFINNLKSSDKVKKAYDR